MLITVGTGIGAGIVLDGRLYRGRFGSATGHAGRPSDVRQGEQRSGEERLGIAAGTQAGDIHAERIATFQYYAT